MSNINTEGLPPEMQQRIADIIEKAKANAVQSYAPAAPTQPGPVAAPGLQNPGALAQRPPSLMDHTIALRQEVDASSSFLVCPIPYQLANASLQFVDHKLQMVNDKDICS